MPDLMTRTMALSLFAMLISAPTEAKANTKGQTTVVWHQDATQMWVGRGHKAAKMEAYLLKQCNRTMNGGCKVVMSFAIGGVAIASLYNGVFIAGYSKNSLAEARRDLMESECLKYESTCVMAYEFEAPQKPVKASYQIPKATPELFRLYGAIAWQNPVSVPIRVWVATGRRTLDLARGDALANCKADTGGECALAQAGGDSTMIVYTDSSKQLRATQARTLDSAQELVKATCAKDNVTCRTHVVINSRAEETSVHKIGQ